MSYKARSLRRKLDGNRAPGLKTRLWILDSRYIEEYPARATIARIDDSIVLVDSNTYPDAKWHQLEVLIDTPGTEIKQEGEAGAKHYSGELSMQYDGTNEEALEALGNLSGGIELIVGWEGKDGSIRIAGERHNGCFMEFSENTGKKSGDFIGYEIKVKLPTVGKPFPYYKGDFTPIEEYTPPT